MKMKQILIPIPSYGFDPTEVAIPWKLLSEKSFEIVFITPEGKKASADSLTRLWLKDYYLTYPEITIENETKSVLSDSDNFIKGPTPLIRDSQNHLNRDFVVKDRNYLSARWSGDAYTFSLEFIKMIQDLTN